MPKTRKNARSPTKSFIAKTAGNKKRESASVCSERGQGLMSSVLSKRSIRSSMREEEDDPIYEKQDPINYSI
jgi:hypothetical protein